MLSSIKTFRQNVFTDEGGYVLQIVLIFMLIMLILGFSILTLASQENRLAYNYQQRAEALYFAQSGIKKAVWRINHGNNASASFSIPEMAVNYDSLQKKITANGIKGNHIRTIEVYLEPDHQFRHILNYQQLNMDQGTVIASTPGNEKQYCHDFSLIDLPYWNSIADFHYTGNKVFTDIVTSGIHYIDGNVTIQSVYSFEGAIVATGDIKLKYYSILQAKKIPDSNDYYPVLISGDSIICEHELGYLISGAVCAGSYLELLKTYATGPLTAPKINLKLNSYIMDGIKRIYYSYPPGFESAENKDWYKIEKYKSWRMLN